MSAKPTTPSSASTSGEALAPVSDLQDYGATIVAELDKAEAELDDTDNQPFSGMSTAVMADLAELRESQFDMFRRHVEIERAYKIRDAVGDGNDVQRMSFSGIATTMRKKESATAGLLNRLADFDKELRAVMERFENPSRPSNAADDQQTKPDSTTRPPATTRPGPTTRPGVALRPLATASNEPLENTASESVSGAPSPSASTSATASAYYSAR